MYNQSHVHKLLQKYKLLYKAMSLMVNKKEHNRDKGNKIKKQTSFTHCKRQFVTSTASLIWPCNRTVYVYNYVYENGTFVLHTKFSKKRYKNNCKFNSSLILKVQKLVKFLNIVILWNFKELYTYFSWLRKHWCQKSMQISGSIINLLAFTVCN